ncbi:MAG TPA: 50S ribosomal protein L31e [Dongiaceae bacterium]|nr:50S ribosomal protein L31e [Dongiaceae bacterium]
MLTSKEKKPKKKAKTDSKEKAVKTPKKKKEDSLAEKPEQESSVKEESEERLEEIAEEPKEVIEAPEAPEAPAEPEEPEEEELEIVEEKFYDLNLRRIWNAPREKRTPRAVRFLREFVAQRMKTTEVSLSEETNSMLWQRGISKPPRKIRIRVVKDKEGRVIVFPGEGKSRASDTV